MTTPPNNIKIAEENTNENISKKVDEYTDEYTGEYTGEDVDKLPSLAKPLEFGLASLFINTLVFLVIKRKPLRFYAVNLL